MKAYFGQIIFMTLRHAFQMRNYPTAFFFFHENNLIDFAHGIAHWVKCAFVFIKSQFLGWHLALLYYNQAKNTQLKKIAGTPPPSIVYGMHLLYISTATLLGMQHIHC